MAVFFLKKVLAQVERII